MCVAKVENRAWAESPLALAAAFEVLVFSALCLKINNNNPKMFNYCLSTFLLFINQ